MKRLFALAMAMFSATTGHSSEIARVVVDDAHLQLERPGKPDAINYELPPTDQLEIDATDYEFRLPEKLNGRKLNSVQFAFAKDRVYSASWPASEKRLVLSRSNLVPNPDSKPFEGIRSGDSGVIAIGVLDGSSFFVVWVGMFTVQ
jgi:hypothetical protein